MFGCSLVSTAKEFEMANSVPQSSNFANSEKTPVSFLHNFLKPLSLSSLKTQTVNQKIDCGEITYWRQNKITNTKVLSVGKNKEISVSLINESGSRDSFANVFIKEDPEVEAANNLATKSMEENCNIEAAPGEIRICPRCSRSFKGLRSLIRHQRFQCGKIPQYQCPFCPHSAYYYLCNLRSHLRTHERTKVTKNSHLKLKSVLTRKIAKKMPGKLLNDPRKGNSNLIPARSAVQTKLNTKRIKSVNSQQGMTLSHLKKKTVMEGDKFIPQGQTNDAVPQVEFDDTGVPIDENVYYNEVATDDEGKEKLPRRKRKKTCPRCFRKFGFIGNLHRHQMFECGKSPQFQCTYCQASFFFEAALLRHIIIHTRNSGLSTCSASNLNTNLAIEQGNTTTRKKPGPKPKINSNIAGFRKLPVKKTKLIAQAADNTILKKTTVCKFNLLPQTNLIAHVRKKPGPKPKLFTQTNVTSLVRKKPGPKPKFLSQAGSIKIRKKPGPKPNPNKLIAGDAQYLECIPVYGVEPNNVENVIIDPKENFEINDELESSLDVSAASILEPVAKIDDNNEPKKEKCPNCSKSYTTLHALKQHRQFHCGKLPQFKCSMCEARYYYNQSLNLHMRRIHTNIKKIVKPRKYCFNRKTLKNCSENNSLMTVKNVSEERSVIENTATCERENTIVESVENCDTQTSSNIESEDTILIQNVKTLSENEMYNLFKPIE